MDEAWKSSGHGRTEGCADPVLSGVSAGTPCGELLRRYWHPVCESARVSTTPRKIRLLGEDLVVFRDGSGRPGLLYSRCIHRGTTLYYGKVEKSGIRCCYHGWLFDVEGRCLNQPCEPGGGRNLHRYRQPAYPVEERYGLLFAYLGPADSKPVLPRYDNLESLQPGEVLGAFVGGFGSSADRSLRIVPHSWLHMNDNSMDPFHVHILHSTFSTVQFDAAFSVTPQVEFFPSQHGVSYAAIRTLPDGRSIRRISSWFLPNVVTVLDLQMKASQSSGISWFVPVDETHHVHAIVSKVPEGMSLKELELVNGKRWAEMTEEEHRATPGDYEAQVGQGPVTLHSEEHLVTSDRGIVMQRRLLKEQIAAVQAGRAPLGVAFNEADALITVRAGNFPVSSSTGVSA
jgi:nitrite reductase/ring-hydroxylating ferredoxin subunit